MTTFIVEGICNLFHTIRSRFGFISNDSRKRERDSEDEEDEQNKRPKWMSSTSGCQVKMDSNETQPTPCLSKGVMAVTVPIKKKSSQHRLSSDEGRRTEDDVIETIDLESENNPLMKHRQPLSNLTVGLKSNSVSKNIIYNGSIRCTAKKSHFHVRKQNGVQPSLFNPCLSPIRQLKISSVPKQSALEETFRLKQKLEYSKLLENYHKSSRNVNILAEMQRTIPPNLTQNGTFKSESSSKSIDIIDLTKDKKKHTLISVKPWQGAGASEENDDVVIIEERPILRVNSLEKQLSQCNMVTPEWIKKLTEKYSEKRRETMRQVDEENIRKALYAEHNQKFCEALDARILNRLKITDIILDDTEEIPTLPEITQEMKEKINSALQSNPQNEVLVEGFGQRITRADIQTLNKLNWLNDEVINFYMNLLIERSKEIKNPSVYAFNTFFYPKLISQGYSTLRRWTKKVDIFTHQLLLVPIHLQMHWCLATIDFRDKKIRYYDSMGSKNSHCLNALLNYLTEESMDKKQKPYDVSDWSLENVKDIPQQMNGSDCGMFSCMFAEYLSRNVKITFSQKDMPYFRRKMVYEIISKKLLD